MEEISAGDTKNEFLCICARLKLFLMADSIVKNHSKKKKKRRFHCEKALVVMSVREKW